MIDNPQVNRCLTCVAMDHIDHALGRPMWPLKETYRNHFAVEPESEIAEQFGASDHWVLAYGSIMHYYSVTDAGRQALAEWLKEHDPHRAYRISFEGHSWTIPATSRGKARYLAWLRVSDCWELTFKEFLLGAKVRLI